MASGWTSSPGLHSNSHMPARNVLTMLAGAIFCITHGRTVNLVHVASAAEMLRCLVAYLEDLAGHPVRPGPALGLLDGYLKSLTSLDEPPSSELAPIIGGHLLDLVAAALGPTAEAAEIIAKRGVKAARLRAVIAEIARHFMDPNFDLDNVAGALGLSRRYVQRLLKETGQSSPSASWNAGLSARLRC
jgi:hypothetical protein